MNPSWFAVAISAIGLVPAIYAFRSAWRTRATDRGNVVFQNALQLAEANSKEAESLRTKLVKANGTIDDLTEKLRKMSQDLYDAHAELTLLRGQVESMSRQVNGE